VEKFEKTGQPDIDNNATCCKLGDKGGLKCITYSASCSENDLNLRALNVLTARVNNKVYRNDKTSNDSGFGDAAGQVVVDLIVEPKLSYKKLITKSYFLAG